MKKLIISFACIVILKHSYAQPGGVGINTDNPQATLHVHGNGKFDSIPEVLNMEYIAGYDEDGFMLKTPTNQIKGQEVFPDIIGWGFGITGGTGGYRPNSIYQSHRDKLSYLGFGSELYFQGDSMNWQFRDLIGDWSIGQSDFTARAGAVSLGNYLYILIENRSTFVRRVYRYLRSNINAGGTLMSFSGLTLGASNINTLTMTSDGVYFYINHNAGNHINDNVIAKYSLSGTTFVYVSSVTIGSVGDFNKSFLVDASGNYYGASSNAAELFKKFSSSGTLIYSWKGSQAFFINWLDNFYSSRNSSYQVYEKFNK